MIKFLRCSEGSELKISGTITNPYTGQVKGGAIKLKISNSELFRKFECQLNSLLCDIHNEMCSVIGLNNKACFPANHYTYSDEELDKIIADLDLLGNFVATMFKGNRHRGYLCHYWYLNLKEKCGWGNSHTKEYSFLYDLCVLLDAESYIGDGFSGTIGKEKYDAVKNWIAAYKTQAEKWNDAYRKKKEKDQ